jgi:hypothetical protein
MDAEREGDQYKPKYEDDAIDLERYGVVDKLVEQDPTITAVNADIIGATDLDWEAAGKAFGTNRFLKYLSIEVSESGKQHLSAFFAGLANNRSIERLELYWGGGDDSETLEVLLPFFKNNDNLVQLKIDSDYDRWISENAIIALCTCPSLKSICINNTTSESGRTDKLLRLLTACHTFYEISARGRIEPESMMHLKNILDDPKCQLKSLTLGNCEPHRIFGSGSYNYTLEKLDLSSSRNSLSSVDMNLVDALKRLPNLKMLNLSHCKFETHQVWGDVFKAVLSPTSKLNELILLNAQPPRNSNLAVLAQCILNSTSLKKLDLSRNGWVFKNQWKSFIEQLSGSGCLLEDLTLTGNIHISTLSQKLKFPKMKRLVLAECLMSNSDWIRLVETLNESSIECLEGMTSYGELWDRILPRLLEYKSLRFLHLGALTLEATQFIFNRAESPQCRIESIGFEFRFENEQQVQQTAQDWATSLRRNSTVKSLYLDLEVVRGVSLGAFWREFAQLLGGRDAIDETQSSNHTLEYIKVSADHARNFRWYERDENEDDEVLECKKPVNVYSLLQINRGRNKIAVARRKIVRFHFNGNDGVQKLLDMNMGLVKLPQLLHWIGKEDLDLSIMYGFLCSQPGLFDRDAIEAGRKRKRQDSHDKVVVD